MPLTRINAISARLAQGLEVWTMTPDAFGAYIRSEAAKWTRVIKDTGINET
jgi:tripartite-type tricarboxylate transporter receptor subunit TctC